MPKNMTAGVVQIYRTGRKTPTRDGGSQSTRDRSHRRRRIPAIDSYSSCRPLRAAPRIPRSASASPLAFTLHHGSMPKSQLKTSTCAYLSIHREEEAHYPIVFSLALVFLSSPTESPSPRFHPTRKQEFVVKISPSRVSVDFFLLLPCCYGPLIRGFVDLGKRRWGGRPAAIWREGDGRREGADRGQVSALRRHGHRAHQVRPLHHSLRAQGVHPRSVAAR